MCVERCVHTARECFRLMKRYALLKKKAFRKTVRVSKCLISTFYLITILCDIRFANAMYDKRYIITCEFVRLFIE